MVDRGEDMQQKTTGKIQTRVTAIRTEPIIVVLYLCCDMTPITTYAG